MIQDDLHLPYVKIWHLYFKTVGKMIIVQKERKNPREERSSGGISGGSGETEEEG
jgi:hypothetical protein